jgi:hypothetical protein
MISYLGIGILQKSLTLVYKMPLLGGGSLKIFNGGCMQLFHEHTSSLDYQEKILWLMRRSIKHPDNWIWKGTNATLCSKRYEHTYYKDKKYLRIKRIGFSYRIYLKMQCNGTVLFYTNPPTTQVTIDRASVIPEYLRYLFCLLDVLYTVSPTEIQRNPIWTW